MCDKYSSEEEFIYPDLQDLAHADGQEPRVRFKRKRLQFDVLHSQVDCNLEGKIRCYG
jgi:hypothetical protein